MAKKLKPVHPGIFLDEIMTETGISGYKLAKATGLSQTVVSQIRRQKRAITPMVALRFGRALGQSAELWLGMQARYDLDMAEDRGEAKIIQKIKPLVRLDHPSA